ncbi:hypothetical protein LINPERHAP2_LOCUS15497 [Linum perenne]
MRRSSLLIAMESRPTLMNRRLGTGLLEEAQTMLSSLSGTTSFQHTHIMKIE